jgi:hypothetical protein
MGEERAQHVLALIVVDGEVEHHDPAASRQGGGRALDQGRGPLRRLLVQRRATRRTSPSDMCVLRSLLVPSSRRHSRVAPAKSRRTTLSFP